MRGAWRRSCSVVLATTANISERELICEEAYVHLEDCCPGIRAENVCGDADGCSPRTTLPIAESECILALECGEDLLATCERVEEVALAVDREDDIVDHDVCK